MVSEKERDIFENHGVLEAVMRLAVPTVIGQIILVIYNMADTFFVGLTGNDAMLTAVTVCMPAFMFLSAISNLFGIGGASLIARAYGSRDFEKVHRASAFAFWGCLAMTALYSLLAFFFRNAYVDLLGGIHPDVHRHSVEYITCTVVIGGFATSSATLFSHLIRAEGRATLASIGIMLGGVLNIFLDPLFMFRILPPGREALGAAIATALSNFIALLYFVTVLILLRKKTQIAIRPTPNMFRFRIPKDILSAGIPACIMTLFENISYAVLDKLMSLAGVPMQAGIGVAKKVNMLAHCIVRGIAQGALPLIAYNYAARNYTRMRKSFRVARTIAVGAAALCMLLNLILSRQLIGIFIHHESPSLQYGTVFLRILCVGGPFSAAAYSIISFFQATGEGKKSFFLAILRKGLVDIPLMFLLNTLLPVCGIVASTPVTDAICCAVAYLIFTNYMKAVIIPAERTAKKEVPA